MTVRFGLRFQAANSDPLLLDDRFCSFRFDIPIVASNPEVAPSLRIESLERTVPYAAAEINGEPSLCHDFTPVFVAVVHDLMGRLGPRIALWTNRYQ